MCDIGTNARYRGSAERAAISFFLAFVVIASPLHLWSLGEGRLPRLWSARQADSTYGVRSVSVTLANG